MTQQPFTESACEAAQQPQQAQKNTWDLVPASRYKSPWGPVSLANTRALTQQAVSEGLDLDRQLRGFPNQGLFDISASDLAVIGGAQGFLNIFIRAYEHFLADPHLRVLFNETPDQRSAEEHGKLLGGFLLARLASDETYQELRFSGYGHGLGYGHSRARNCPHRPAEQRGRGFLKSQGYAWLGHVSLSVDEVAAPQSDAKQRFVFKRKLMNGLKEAVFNMYGPWVHDNVTAFADGEDA